MNLRLLASSLALSTAFALLAYGFADYLNALIGADGKPTILNQFWSLEAIALGSSILLAYAYPHLRGVRQGDKLLALASGSRDLLGETIAQFTALPVTALEDGRRGSKIKVQVEGGRRGEGIIVSYAGAVSPAMLQLVEREW